MYSKVNQVPIQIPNAIVYEDPALGEQREKISQLISEFVSLALAQHLVSVECAMYELADHYNEKSNRERWAIAGLLHDIDWDACDKNAELHCKAQSREWLDKSGVDATIVENAFSHYGNVAGVGFQ